MNEGPEQRRRAPCCAVTVFEAERDRWSRRVMLLSTNNIVVWSASAVVRPNQRILGAFAIALCVIAAVAASSALFLRGAAGPNAPRTGSLNHRPGKYPLYSAYFTGRSPFHATVSYLTSLPGTVRLSPTTVANFWNQQWPAIRPSLNTPMLLASPHKKSYRFSCLEYSPNGCNAHGKTIWFNTSELFTESDSDRHIVSVDPISGYEIDGWGGNTSHPCTVSGDMLDCSWGGIFYYDRGGLDEKSSSSAVGGGFAVGAFILGAQDMLDGLSGTPIKHALGMRARCLDNLPNGFDAYPADTTKSTDASCSGGNNGGPAGYEPAYGDLFVLTMTSSQIASSAYSPACKVILNALATYGAYLMDTGGGKNAIWVENSRVYGDADNPWYDTIQPAFGADGTGSGPDFELSSSCMNRLSARDFKLYEIQSGAGMTPSVAPTHG